ncbi:MAG: glycosyltransferase family protein [Candidatus Woesearchaeota archaeon]
MTRIIYGVQGDGFGHSARSSAIIEHLLNKGHEVRVLTSGKGMQLLSKYKPIQIFGLRMSFKDQRVDEKETLRENLERGGLEARETLRSIIKLLKEFKPEIAITDFEPFIPFAARLIGIPFISINHQHILEATKVEYPYSRHDEYVLARNIVANMYWFADHYYVSSFYAPQLRKRYEKRATIVGPILREEITCLKPSTGSHVLAYAMHPEQDQTLKILSKLGIKTVAYGFNKGSLKNITYKKTGTKEFFQDLASAKAVLGTGGFMLPSESLYLGKPYYANPIPGQFEQYVNGYYLEKLGYGLMDEQPTEKRIAQFLNGLDYFRKNIKNDSAKFKGNKVLFNLIDQKITTLQKKL